MKRELFENVKVIPGGINVTIDRKGFLSAVLGVNASDDSTLKIKVEHADSDKGTFAELDDSFAGVTGELNDIQIEAGNTANICIDFIGCKRYVRFSAEGIASGQDVASAVVLGDPEAAPV